MLEGSKAKERKFKETIELQVGLKNYDPQKDKRFSGTVKLPYTPRPSMKARFRQFLLSLAVHECRPVQPLLSLFVANSKRSTVLRKHVDTGSWQVAVEVCQPCSRRAAAEHRGWGACQARGRSPRCSELQELSQAGGLVRQLADGPLASTERKKVAGGASWAVRLHPQSAAQG